MRRRNSIISACLTVVLVGIIVFNVIYDFRPVITHMSDEETPLIGDYGIDFEEKNFDQPGDYNILDEIILKLVDDSEAPGKEEQLQDEIIPIRDQNDDK